MLGGVGKVTPLIPFIPRPGSRAGGGVEGWAFVVPGGEAEGVGAVVLAFLNGACSFPMSSSLDRFNGTEDDMI